MNPLSALSGLNGRTYFFIKSAKPRGGLREATPRVSGLREATPRVRESWPEGRIGRMTSVAMTLARWAARLEPEPGDLELADRSLRDTVAVTLAARDHRVTHLAAALPDGARWAVAGHVLDFDDLHMPSTTHVSAICVPTALATGGGPRAYLAAAGVMARLGTALGWRHYSAGWHATCTAGAPASAAGAAVALGLAATKIAVAMARPCPRPAGFSGRSAPTPSRCRSASPSTPGSARPGWRPRARRPTPRPWTRGWTWLAAPLPAAVDPSGPAVPDGLAIKLYPCCYALQRPISALSELASRDSIPRRSAGSCCAPRRPRSCR